MWRHINTTPRQIWQILRLLKLSALQIHNAIQIETTLADANTKRDYRISEAKTLLNRQNYPKKRLLSDKIAHSGISRDYYCKKFHFWECHSTVFDMNSSWAPIRRSTYLTTSHNMHIFALPISVQVTNARNVCQLEALPRKSESKIILITGTIIRIMILIKEDPE